MSQRSCNMYLKHVLSQPGQLTMTKPEPKVEHVEILHSSQG